MLLYLVNAGLVFIQTRVILTHYLKHFHVIVAAFSCAFLSFLFRGKICNCCQLIIYFASVEWVINFHRYTFRVFLNRLLQFCWCWNDGLDISSTWKTWWILCVDPVLLGIDQSPDLEIINRQHFPLAAFIPPEKSGSIP